MSNLLPVAWIALAVTVLAIEQWRKRSKRSLPLPPGPKGLPIIGNVLDLPQEKPTETYEAWHNEHGPIVHLSVPGKHIILLNTAEAVTELLERRSLNYSSRPQTAMIHDIMKVGEWNFAVQPYGNTWREGRRLLQGSLSQRQVLQYRPIQMRSARAFVKALHEDHHDLHSAVRKFVGSAGVDVIYAVDEQTKDRLIANADEQLGIFASAVKPGSFLVDIFPSLRHLPKGFPGTTFQNVASRFRYLVNEIRDVSMEATEKALDVGTAVPCLTTHLLEHTSEAQASDLACVAFGAAAHTTISVVLTFLLAMCLHPHVQEIAQMELDRVVGVDRLPEFTDRKHLPYLNAVILEVLRWRPVVVLGLPHASVAEDEYAGYRIPKDSIVMGNVWSILHNPHEYPNPHEFRPSRFLKVTEDGALALNEEVRDPRSIIFGFGRRSCVGQHLADQTILATVASVLAAFTISPVEDEKGNALIPEAVMVNEIIAHPAPFKCNIQPRSMEAADLIAQPLPECE